MSKPGDWPDTAGHEQCIPVARYEKVKEERQSFQAQNTHEVRARLAAEARVARLVKALEQAKYILVTNPNVARQREIVDEAVKVIQIALAATPTAESGEPGLREAAQAALDRWSAPSWRVMGESIESVFDRLRAALALPPDAPRPAVHAEDCESHYHNEDPEMCTCPAYNTETNDV